MAQTRILSLAAASVAALAAATAAFAHHGWSTYTVDDFTLEGEVTELRFGNPHDRMTVVVNDVAWDVWLGPPGRNARANFNESKVNVGDTVIAFGERHGNEDRLEMKTERITVVSGEGEMSYDLYPDRLGR